MFPVLRNLKSRIVLALATVLVILAACGGGVDSGGTGTGQSSQATYASGPITGFGSIIVNGVHYDESTASILDDGGTPRTRDDLRLGMLAEVIASTLVTTNTGTSATAASVRFGSQIIGPVDSVDVSHSKLVVFGQSVRVTTSTVFDVAAAGGLSALAGGDLVEVYAQFDVSTRTYVARRIERHATVGAYKLRGVVSALSTADRTILVGGQVISYAFVTPNDPATTLAPGTMVRVTLYPTRLGTAWQALSLSKDATPVSDRESAEVDGRISAFTSATQFVLNGLPVDAAAASFPSGRAGVVLGARVEVAGSIRSGVLVATMIKIEDDESEGFELEGTISAPDAVGKTFVVRNVTVVYTATTRFDSSTAADILAGREVSVKGSLSADGSRLEATSIHVER